MKYIALIILGAGCIAASGCVRRTVTVEPKYANPASKERYGDSHTKYIDTKLVWFWQDEFKADNQ